jgi:type I restriction enzyme R subunit
MNPDMAKKEASARLKINKLLEESGWTLIDEDSKRANVDVETRLRPGEKVNINEAGEDFENVKSGFIDYLLLDDNQKPIAVLEAKRESIPPLSAKEQARNYANGMHVRYVILSNGNVHFLWDMYEGSPEPIVKLPTLKSLTDRQDFKPNPKTLIEEIVDETYIASSQLPGFDQNASYRAGGDQQDDFIRNNKLKIMRHYQVDAVHAIQKAAGEGKKRYLLEMATGTGKTLTCAAIIKLFLKTGNARRVLFLVDRIELETQAQTAFQNAIGSDFTVLTYKKHKDDWGKAEVVVSTVQSLQTNDRYKDEFSPTDFDLVISDEAHRSIGGNARAVFEYFVGYRVGLTATPKDYLKNTTEEDRNTEKDFERRQLLDTYVTFGCESGQPTYSYSLTDGVNDPSGPYLVNPVIIDARTEITTQLLSDEGYAVHKVTDEGTEVDAIFGARHFEHSFFNQETNEVLASTFIDNADTDPISGEVGKSIIFAVSQAHAARLVNILNQQAMERWPGKYQSDFAIQITSNVTDAQNYTTRFSENDLLGHTKWLDEYPSSRARVAVTVGMMTTGYDCSDLQNVCFMRPIFSPSDFIQMKGRGTRLHKFTYVDYEHDEEVIERRKENFKLIDFFAVCEYFNEEYDYKAALSVPKKVMAAHTGYAPAPLDVPGTVEEPGSNYGPIDLHEADLLKTTQTTVVGREGMLVDREMFKKFVEDAREDQELVERDETDREAALEYLKNDVLDRPAHFMTLDKIRKHFKLDRKLGLGEALDIIMGRVDEPKKKAEVIHDKFNDFVALKDLSERLSEDTELFHASYRLFDAYISSVEVQAAIDSGNYGDLENTSQISLGEFGKLHDQGVAEPLLAYIRDYIDIDKLRG